MILAVLLSLPSLANEQIIWSNHAKAAISLAYDAELIAYAKQAAFYGTIANFTFHGVGGDYLPVSIKAHQELLDFLAKNKEIYWVDTYRNISLYIKKNAN